MCFINKCIWNVIQGKICPDRDKKEFFRLEDLHQVNYRPTDKERKETQRQARSFQTNMAKLKLSQCNEQNTFDQANPEF